MLEQNEIKNYMSIVGLYNVDLIYIKTFWHCLNHVADPGFIENAWVLLPESKLIKTIMCVILWYNQV